MVTHRLVLCCCFLLLELFGVLFLIYCIVFFVCVRVMRIGNAPFEEVFEEPAVEEFEQQQGWEEGKYSLIMPVCTK